MSEKTLLLVAIMLICLGTTSATYAALCPAGTHFNHHPGTGCIVRTITTPLGIISFTCAGCDADREITNGKCVGANNNPLKCIEFKKPHMHTPYTFTTSIGPCGIWGTPGICGVCTPGTPADPGSTDTTHKTPCPPTPIKI